MNLLSNFTDRLNPGLAFDRHGLVMPGAGQYRNPPDRPSSPGRCRCHSGRASPRPASHPLPSPRVRAARSVHNLHAGTSRTGAWGWSDHGRQARLRPTCLHGDDWPGRILAGQVLRRETHGVVEAELAPVVVIDRLEVVVVGLGELLQCSDRFLWPVHQLQHVAEPDGLSDSLEVAFVSNQSLLQSGYSLTHSCVGRLELCVAIDDLRRHTVLHLEEPGEVEFIFSLASTNQREVSRAHVAKFPEELAVDVEGAGGTIPRCADCRCEDSSVEVSAGGAGTEAVEYDAGNQGAKALLPIRTRAAFTRACCEASS